MTDSGLTEQKRIARPIDIVRARSFGMQRHSSSRVHADLEQRGYSPS
ncbi:MAG TPA: hypothetical protein VIS77_04660 [Burkholderiales bacterium]